MDEVEIPSSSSQLCVVHLRFLFVLIVDDGDFRSIQPRTVAEDMVQIDRATTCRHENTVLRQIVVHRFEGNCSQLHSTECHSGNEVLVLCTSLADEVTYS